MQSFSRPWLGVAALAATVFATACSGPGAGVAPAGEAARAARGVPSDQTRANVGRLIRRRSHVDPDATKDRLLYVADPGSNAVLIYTYPQLSGAGALSGFSSVDGVCTDRQGYVWVLDTSDVAVWEFAHGGTQPINVLTPGDVSGNPGVGNGCSVNPKTGDLAVAGAGPGLTIFRNGQFTHATYWDFNFFQFAYAGYDNKGNLYADGRHNSSFTFGLVELPSGASSLSEIALSGGAFSGPGGIQWDGKYLDVGDSGSGTIYLTDGAAVLGSVATSAVCQGQFFITPNRERAIVPDPCSASTGVYAYAAGGSPVKTASGGQQIPEGAALSVAGR